MEIPLLNDIAVIFALAIFVIYVFNKIHIPSIIGFLLTGIIAGPYSLALVKATHEVEIMAEIGIVLLLFTIGMEFSIESLIKIRRTVFLGGTIQVLFSVILGFLASKIFGMGLGQSIFIGYLIALSSTAIVIKLIQDKGEVDSPHGRTIVGLLIFQDIIAIPMMLTIPLLAGHTAAGNQPIYLVVGKIVGILMLIFLASKYVIPKLITKIVETRINELFLITIGGICMGTAILTSSLGLSLALGAFIAGLIVSESEYSHQALGYIIPFKDIFTSFFFVSVGMLLNVSFFFEHFLTILLLTCLAILLKVMAGIPAALFSGYPFRSAVLSAIAISQIGEFSFVLSKVGITNKLLDNFQYQMFLAVSILTMAVTPFLINLSPKISALIVKLKLAKIDTEEVVINEALTDHIVIIGFGLNGQNLARVAAEAQIPYVILETNAKTVKKYRELGEPIYYGDATYELILDHINIRKARIVVVAISDPAATRKTVSLIRSIDPSLTIIVRSRYLQEFESLFHLGANEVISEEFESSIEIFSRVLSKYLVSKDEIEDFTNKIREERYDMVRNISKKSGTTNLREAVSYIHDIEIVTLKLYNDSSLINNTIIDIDLRRKYNVTILAIQRNNEIISNPDSNTQLLANDRIVLMGDISDINNVEDVFRGKVKS